MSVASLFSEGFSGSGRLLDWPKRVEAEGIGQDGKGYISWPARRVSMMTGYGELTFSLVGTILAVVAGRIIYSWAKQRVPIQQRPPADARKLWEIALSFDHQQTDRM